MKALLLAQELLAHCKCVEHPNNSGSETHDIFGEMSCGVVADSLERV